jgi:hypothetical protein
MPRITYTKFDEIILLLKSGWVIYTSRGSAPYNPVYYHIWSPDEKNRKAIHFQTIEKLIRDNIINGRDSKHGKYELKEG